MTSIITTTTTSDYGYEDDFFLDPQYNQFLMIFIILFFVFFFILVFTRGSSAQPGSPGTNPGYISPWYLGRAISLGGRGGSRTSTTTTVSSGGRARRSRKR